MDEADTQIQSDQDCIFSCAGSCLYDFDEVDQEKLAEILRPAQGLGIFGLSGTVVSGVKSRGNWVGGRVAVYPDRIIFTINAANRLFQPHLDDLSIHVQEISHPRLGKKPLCYGLFSLKTVDFDYPDKTMRFRCMGRQNDRLLSVLQTLV